MSEKPHSLIGKRLLDAKLGEMVDREIPPSAASELSAVGRVVIVGMTGACRRSVLDATSLTLWRTPSGFVMAG